jgi:Cu/Ag efflux protein CusF
MKQLMKRMLSGLLVAALMVTLLTVNLPETVNAATSSNGRVTTKSVNVKSKKYSLSVKQQDVNKRKVTLKFSKIKQLKKAKISKVKVQGYMTYNKKDIAVYSKTIKLSKISSKTGEISAKLPYFGKYKIKVTYYDKKGKKVKSVTAKKVGVVAEEYNIALINGTFGNLFFTLSLWDINKGENGNTIPTIVSLNRQDAYDWSKLPSDVYKNPMEGSLKQGQMVKKQKAMTAYVKDLYSLNKNSKFHLYLADNYIKGILETMCKNKIKDTSYNVILLSDGSGTYAWFNSMFGGSNAQSVYDDAVADWNSMKKKYLQGKTVDCEKAKYAISGSCLSLSKYTYPVVASSDNVEWWVARKNGTFNSKNSEFLSKALESMTEKSLSGMLTDLQSKGDATVAKFKALYHFSNQMFAEAVKNNKKVMILMGSRITSETNFEEFASYVMKHYGSEYEYYYKGHPATPTKLYPEKQKQLDKLGIHDVESSIAAELILFFYPNVYCSGMSNSTLNYSYKEGKVGGYLGVRLADKTTITGGELFQFFFTKIDSSYETQITSLCNMSHKNYLVEFSNNAKADISIYDYTTKTEKSYKLVDGSYQLVK